MDLLKLKTVNALSDTITICEYEGMQVIKVVHPAAEAGITLHGGHLIWFRPAGEKDVIWLSEKAEFTPSKALRGGIPVCWPWFGRVATPAHGFARTSMWSLIEHRENESGVIVELGLTDSDETLAIWPNRFDLKITFEISSELKVKLTATNTDDHNWSMSGALHSYFTVGDVREISIEGMGSDYIGGLKDAKTFTGGNSLVFTEALDRVYTAPDDTVTINDARNTRNLLVTNRGHNSAVIWNPWAEGAAGMGDMDDDGYLTMVCVESTQHGDGITLQPGESHSLETQISVKAQ